jgi:hypothetical protein
VREFYEFLPKPRILTMTKSKAQKAKAKSKRQQQRRQPMDQQQPQQKKQRTRKRSRNSGQRNRDGGGDNSQTRGMNNGQLRTMEPRTGVIEKRELVQLVSGTTAFQALKFPLNPGLVGTFPLGGTEAKNWTEWRCTQMRVDYIPTVSEFATQGQQGEVAIAVDYNADNLPPTAMNQIEAMHFAGGGIPSKGFTFHAKTKLMNKSDPKYVRIGNVPAGDDLRLYDGGNLYFSTSGCTNTTQIGKLEVTYRFEMGLPTLLNQGAGGLSDTGTAQFTGTAEAGGATTVAKQLLLAVATGGPGFVNTAGSIVPPAGNYLLIGTVATNFSGLGTSSITALYKNGVAVSPTNSAIQFTSGSITIGETSILAIVNANGTDAFTVANTAIYSTGAVTNSAVLVFEPI